MSRLPDGMLKKTNTSSTQANGNRVRVSPRCRRRLHAGIAHGNTSMVGSHAVNATSMKYQGGWP